VGLKIVFCPIVEKSKTNPYWLLGICLLLNLKIDVVDQEPHRKALVLIVWIRIRIGNAEPDPDPGGAKMTHVK
jgi:hypothetical protein